MAQTRKPLTRDSLVSMQVIDSNGQLVGKVADIAFEVGKTGVSLAVETQSGETKIVEWSEVQAASDFIILRAQSQSLTQTRNQTQTTQPQETTQQPKQILTKQKTPPLCPTCNKPLKWIPKYKRYYCYDDKKYC
ncbi:MAG: PRC-barrel domain-containing protein [Candidatus Bathyarchaeia archaeon]|jgi:sporulation protein YlmC with PRC-barrel domain